MLDDEGYDAENSFLTWVKRKVSACYTWCRSLFSTTTNQSEYRVIINDDNNSTEQNGSILKKSLARIHNAFTALRKFLDKSPVVTKYLLSCLSYTPFVVKWSFALLSYLKLNGKYANVDKIVGVDQTSETIKKCLKLEDLGLEKECEITRNNIKLLHTLITKFSILITDSDTKFATSLFIATASGITIWLPVFLYLVNLACDKCIHKNHDFSHVQMDKREGRFETLFYNRENKVRPTITWVLAYLLQSLSNLSLDIFSWANQSFAWYKYTQNLSAQEAILGPEITSMHNETKYLPSICYFKYFNKNQEETVLAGDDTCINNFGLRMVSALNDTMSFSLFSNDIAFYGDLSGRAFSSIITSIIAWTSHALLLRHEKQINQRDMSSNYI